MAEKSGLFHFHHDLERSFFAQKLVLEADDDKFDAIVKEVAELVHRVDPDCTMVL